MFRTFDIVLHVFECPVFHLQPLSLCFSLGKFILTYLPSLPILFSTVSRLLMKSLNAFFIHYCAPALFSEFNLILPYSFYISIESSRVAYIVSFSLFRNLCCSYFQYSVICLEHLYCIWIQPCWFLCLLAVHFFHAFLID